MDYVTLPIASADTTLGQALEILKSGGKSGLVADVASRPTVVDIVDILSAWRETGGTKTLAEMTPRVRTIRLPTEEPAEAVLRRHGMRQTTEVLIDSEGAGYAVTQVMSGRGEVITRSEQLAKELLQFPRICRCSNDANHIWLERDVTDHKCPQDQSQLTCD